MKNPQKRKVSSTVVHYGNKKNLRQTKTYKLLSHDPTRTVLQSCIRRQEDNACLKDIEVYQLQSGLKIVDLADITQKIQPTLIQLVYSEPSGGNDLGPL